MRQLPAKLLQVGMILAEDLCTCNGQRLLARGYEVTASFVERAQNFKAGFLREPVRVVLPRRNSPS
jgi:hypothetical protein